MKTSNKLIITALLIFICSLVGYDLALKAQYKNLKKSGRLVKTKEGISYTDYDELNFKNFKDIDIQSANFMNVNVVHGEKEEVWVKKGQMPLFDITQNENSLNINLSKRGNRKFSLSTEIDIFIVSPKVYEIRTGTYSNKLKENLINGRLKVIVSGFSQDSLQVNVSTGAQITLNRNQLKILNSKVGDKSGNGFLKIASDNTIQALKLEALNKSTVEILDTDIKDIDYKVADNAMITLSGKSLREQQNHP